GLYVNKFIGPIPTTFGSLSHLETLIIWRWRRRGCTNRSHHRHCCCCCSRSPPASGCHAALLQAPEATKFK
ncbi:unnamed protein product, partial [Closterium sp. Naga37s-1]